MHQRAARLELTKANSSGERMIDWSQPWPLSKVTEDAGFTMSDVAFVSGLDESTVSRLWDDPKWLDRVSGRSLQSLVASVPGVAEYFASHSVLTRRNKLITQLEAEGLVVNRPALLLSASTEIPHQYLINALEAALSIMRGDARRVCSYLARFWGLQQNRALESLYAPEGDRALLQNPNRLFEASVEMAPHLARKGYSFHSILALATFAHHLGIATGELDNRFLPPITDRQSAFMVRSGIMGLLINSNDADLAQRYEEMVKNTRVLEIIEEWSFPTYTRDSRPNTDFSLPGSILLRRTAEEILDEIHHYTEAYLYYLCCTYLPLALNRDPTFGLRITDLGNALAARIETCDEAIARRACIDLACQIKESS
jgi:hypothetical protein